MVSITLFIAFRVPKLENYILKSLRVFIDKKNNCIQLENFFSSHLKFFQSTFTY